jgi:ketosteroid isomerase-like protein
MSQKIAWENDFERASTRSVTEDKLILIQSTADVGMRDIIMKKILLIGLDSAIINFSAPNVPAGLNAEKLNAILADEQKIFADQGDRLDLCPVKLDGSAEATVAARLAQTTYDYTLIGGGIREPENLEVLERVVNAIHRHAPASAIGFVNHPEDAPKTVARLMSNESPAAPPTSSARAAHILSLMKKGDDAFNRQDIKAMNAAHHPEIIAHVTGNEQPIRGRAAHAAAMEGMFRAFPDIHIDNDPYPIQFGDGDWMTVVTRATGTFSGELVLPNRKRIPGTGKSFEVTFSTTARWEEDLLVEEYVLWDSAVMNRQIGIEN